MSSIRGKIASVRLRLEAQRRQASLDLYRHEQRELADLIDQFEKLSTTSSMACSNSTPMSLSNKAQAGATSTMIKDRILEG
ncbi:unnamed protein product, partial [Amoebophrya sp. A25]|eukprot:GSA25T00019896001.1